MSVLDRSRDFDRSTHIEVNEAQLVGQQLDLVRKLIDVVKEYSVLGWGD